MNCLKTGQLIHDLRKEKHLTQKELADQMNLSDKTISKWERGLGCPDVSLLKELSNLLGVNIENILDGEMKRKVMDGGNMKHIQFYACPICGNVITAVSEADVSCCHHKLAPLLPQDPDEQHSLQVSLVENDYYIQLKHGMTKDHFISFAAYVTYDNVLIFKLYPEQDAALRFPKNHAGALYYYCTKDGLFLQKRLG